MVELGIQTNEHFSSHPDVIVLGQNNEGETERITVDDVRLLKNRFSGYATREQGWRVAVLEQAHTMTHEAANALLKILEEPGKKTLFVLCVQTHELLIPTVRSRCHMVYVTQNFSDVGTAPEEKKERELCTAFINGTRTEQWALLETVLKKKVRTVDLMWKNCCTCGSTQRALLGGKRCRKNNALRRVCAVVLNTCRICVLILATM